MLAMYGRMNVEFEVSESLASRPDRLAPGKGTSGIH